MDNTSSSRMLPLFDLNDPNDQADPTNPVMPVMPAVPVSRSAEAVPVHHADPDPVLPAPSNSDDASASSLPATSGIDRSNSSPIGACVGANGAEVTAADARLVFAGWHDLTEARRRGMASSLTGMAHIMGQDEAAIVLSCTALNAVLFTKPPAAHGMEPQRFGRIVSDLRCIMRRLGLHAPDLRGRAALDPAWQAIHDLLPSAYRQAALAGFFGFCSLHHLPPAQVDDATLTAYEAWLRTDTLNDDAAGRARRTASNWTWAAGAVAGWPTGALRRPSMREQYTLPFDAYPASFRADVEHFAARMACSDLEDLFDEDLPASMDAPHAAAIPAALQKGSPRRGRRVCAPRTVETRLFHIRQAAAALVHTGIPPAELTALRDLVTPIERGRAILTFFWERAKKQPTTQTGGIAETLRQIARYYVHLPQPDLDRLAKWTVRVTPPPRTRMADKNMRRLRALLEPRNRAALLHLPQELLEQAKGDKITPKAAARLVAEAVALDILLAFPMRKGNLAGLRLDQHLMRLTPGSRHVSHIFLTAAEMKNRVDMHWPLPAENAAFIELYIRRYRPLIAAPGNPYLFPGPGLVARSAHELGIGLSRRIYRSIGTPVHLHLLRHFAVALYLRANPGGYEVARQILGHSRVSTTIAFYSGLEADASARHFDAQVLAERAETRSIAETVYRKLRRRRRGAATTKAGGR